MRIFYFLVIIFLFFVFIDISCNEDKKTANIKDKYLIDNSIYWLQKKKSNSSLRYTCKIDTVYFNDSVMVSLRSEAKFVRENIEYLNTVDESFDSLSKQYNSKLDSIQELIRKHQIMESVCVTCREVNINGSGNYFFIYDTSLILNSVTYKDDKSFESKLLYSTSNK
jgi:hypothetical protein